MKKILTTILAAALAGGVWGSENFYQDSGDANLWHIANLDGLKEFRDSVNGGEKYTGKTVQLETDVDLSLDVDANNQQVSWEPIGRNTPNSKPAKDTSSIRFDGTFNGNGHEISNLYINDTDLVGAGLFGIAQSGEIKNLTLCNVDITAKSWIGSVVGFSYSKITNCDVTGTIDIDGHYMQGGVVGQSYADISGCDVNGTSKATSHLIAVYQENDLEADKVGGIVGHWRDGSVGSMVNCSVSNLAIAGSRDVGGMVGYWSSYCTMAGCSVSDLTITANTPLSYAQAKSAKIHFGGVFGSIAGDDSRGSIQVTVQNIDLCVENSGVEEIAKMGYVSGGKYSVNPMAGLSNVANAGIVVSGSNSSQGIQSCDNVFVQAPGVPVAQIGDKTYATLAAAVAAAKDGETVTLLADVTDDTLGAKGIVIDGANTITLDLAGHSITCTDGSAANNRMIKLTGTTTLNVVNSSETVGMMDVLGANAAVANTSTSTTLPYGVFRAEAGTTLNVTAANGNIKLVNGRAWGLNVKLCGATATLTGVTIESQYGGGIEVTEADLGTSSVTGSATLTGCTFTQTGYFDHCSTTLSVSGGSALTVNGGTYSGEQALYVFSSGGVITVEDGTFTGNGGRAAFVAAIDTQTYPSYTGGMTLKDGKFSGSFNITSPAYVSATGGLYSADPSAYVAAGCAAVALDAGSAEYAAGYRYAIGTVKATGLGVDETEQAATDTSANYTVNTVVTLPDGTTENLGTSQKVNVSVAAADIAGTKLSSVKLDAVVQAAVASAGADAASVTKVEIYVESDVAGTAEGSITYEVKPEMVVTVTKNDVATESAPIELTNADLAAGASFTFDLDVTALGVADGAWVKVIHVSSDYPEETNLYKAKTVGGKKVVTVTTSHFSTFSASPADTEGADAVLLPSVTNTIVSANCFGAISITDSAAATAFVAVPFGAFGVGDSQIAAADVVQAASLSEGDKMYVWNGAAGAEQKYEVYKVAANGTWVVDDKKVTVAADGKVTVGSESPDSVTVPTGTGVFIERKDATKPIFVYGQVLTNTVAETTFASGLTLVSPPSTNAMASVNLNALTWSGVSDITTTNTTSGMTIVKSYKDADFIYYRNAANAIVRYYHCNEKWGTVIGTWKEAEAVIPAGTAFWYSKNGGGETKVTW